MIVNEIESYLGIKKFARSICLKSDLRQIDMYLHGNELAGIRKYGRYDSVFILNMGLDRRFGHFEFIDLGSTVNVYIPEKGKRDEVKGKILYSDEIFEIPEVSPNDVEIHKREWEAFRVLYELFCEQKIYFNFVRFINMFQFIKVNFSFIKIIRITSRFEEFLHILYGKFISSRS